MAVRRAAMIDAIRRRAKKLKPVGKRGMVMVRRLGRSYKTGGFQRIVETARGKGGAPLSLERRRKIAGARYWAMVRARGG
jgi:hypothetical protein